MTNKIEDKHAAFVLQDEIRRTEEARYDHRLHAVLLVARGMSCPKVADVLGDPERTVRHWVDRFNDEGLPGLVETEKPGRPAKLTERQYDTVGKVIRRDPREAGMTTGIWDGKTLAAFVAREFKVKLGVRQCQRIFSYLGFRLRKPRPMIARSDPQKQHDFKKK
jgi:transposase